MLTEDQARELLRLAGETVDVAPSGSIDVPPGRRGWPLLAAAAAAVLVVASLGALVVNDRGHDGPPVADGHGQASRIPSVFGYRAHDAAALLEGLGLQVTVQDEDACDTPGRALGTRPPTGAAYTPGEVVTVLRSTGDLPTAFCVVPPERAEAWAFLDFANGRGPAPTFAPEVSLWVDGEHTTTLTPDEAADPESWGEGSALQRLAADSRQVVEQDGHHLTPGLTSQPDDGTQFVCGGQDLPPALAGRRSQMLAVGVPTEGVSIRCAFVNVFRTAGRIDAVVLRTDSGARQPR